MTELREVDVRINGVSYKRAIAPRLLLTDFLRSEIGLTGTHVGCEHGVCGCCTILFDGSPVRACLLFAVQATGHDLTTVEGLANDGLMTPLQEAFRQEHGLQCGFCTPGILMTLTAFLRDHPAPSREETREALSGNLCRCTGYVNILNAVERTIEAR